LDSDLVTVTMPYWGVGADVRRAVDSILGQTHRNVQLVVVNDHDVDDPPWPYLADITDPRLIRFDLRENRGRYFVDQVIFEATQPAWWALQDPDDAAFPRRFEIMLERAQGKGMAVAPRVEYWPGGKTVHTAGKAAFGRRPEPNRMVHIEGYGSAVISGERVAAAGGFHADVRISYDSYLMNACVAQGGVGMHPEPLQHKYRLNPNSLTQAPATRLGSPERIRVRALLEQMWIRAWQRWQQGLEIASVVRDAVSEETREAASRYAAELAAVIAAQQAEVSG